MTGAPASLHDEHRVALDRLHRALAAVLLSAAERAATGSADHRRPLGAGVRPTQHEAASAFSGRQRGFEEDGRDDCSTATADI
jgi:hypothetical protein